jgi:glycosyltransferase involved in cell wall biosynthesis
MMKVLLITPSYFPIVGGSETLTLNLATKLNEHCTGADILTLNMNEKWKPKWKELVEEDILFKVFKEPALNLLPELPNPLNSLLRTNVIPFPNFLKKAQHYDILHFVGEADLSLPLFSHFISKPRVMHCVGLFRNGGLYYYYTFRRFYLRKIFKKFFSNLANLFLVSSFEEQNILAELGVPISKVVTLPDGVDIHVFKPYLARKTDNTILFVGRIDRIKGLHLLIRALSYLKTPVRLVIIGPRWDSEYFDEIEQMCRVIIRKGFHKIEMYGQMNQDDLVPWYQQATLLVCPYLYETHSNVVREALACGTPVISAGTHFLQNGSDGILVVPKDPIKIADAIEKLLEDAKLRNDYSRLGRKLMEEYFSWECVIQKLNNIYSMMLE